MSTNGGCSLRLSHYLCSREKCRQFTREVRPRVEIRTEKVRENKEATESQQRHGIDMLQIRDNEEKRDIKIELVRGKLERQEGQKLGRQERETAQRQERGKR